MKQLLAALITMLTSLSLNAQTLGDTLATSIDDPLEGLTVNVLGDSYVANHRQPKEETWHAQVAARHGMHYNNYGRNGGCVAFDRTSEGFGPSLLVRYKDMDPQADLVLIIAGHNDAGMVGTCKDSLGMFTDSLSLLIDRIRAHCPKAKVAYVTPWYVDRPGFKPVVKAIKKVCKQKDVPVLDNYTADCPVQVRDSDFRRRYFQRADDTAHLNAAGHKLFLPTGEAFVLQVLNTEQ